MDKIIEGVILTPLKQIVNPKGDLYHAMKQSDNGYKSFGEAYFSTVIKDEIKGQTIVCIISGGNNDINRMQEIEEKSLVYEG